MNYPPDEPSKNNEELAEENPGEPQAGFGVDENLAENSSSNGNLDNNYEEEIIEDNKPHPNPLLRKERGSNPTTAKPPSKIFFVVFALLGFGTLLFGFISLARNIKSPFYTAPATEITAENNSTGEQALSAGEIAALKTTDTDTDGLSDYDETYTYKTSPYLADTDSDGYSDKQEIDSGHDPLCPAGRDCRALETETATPETVTLPTGAENLNTEPVAPDENAGTVELTEEEKNQLKQLTPAEVRQLLLESGKMTADQLGQITDEQLMAIFLESLK